MDARGQISAEFLIVLAILAALALLLADQLSKSSEKMGKTFESKIEEINEAIEGIGP